MKKYLFISIVVILTSLLVSCTSQPVTTTTVTTVKTTVTEPGTNGFLIKKVIKGDTLWGYSTEVYGKGIEWREILAENPFLNNPDRIKYDETRQMWIVILKPGETVRIRGIAVTPTYTVEETTTKTTTEPGHASVMPTMEWWGWLVIVGGIALLIWLFGFYRPNFISNISTSNSSSSSAVRVDIHNGIDLDTRRAIIERDQEFRDDVLFMMDRDAKRKGRLHGFIMDVTPGRFFVAADYYQRSGGRKDRRKDEPKKDAAN